MINNLQVLRAFGAIMIFIHHFGFNEPISRTFGDFAVAIFMILSGFVLCAAHQEKYIETGKSPSIKIFICKRIFKIYPLYIVSLFVMLYLYRFNCNPIAILLDIFLLQSWIPNAEYYFSGNGPAWFLSSIFFCYFMFFPLLKLITHRYEKLKYYIIGIIYIIYFIIVLIIPTPWENAIIYINPIMQTTSFLLGIILWQIYKRFNNYKPGYYIVILAICICVIFDIIAIQYNIQERYTLSSWWWIPSSVLVISLSLTDPIDNAISKIIKNKFILAFGNASFSFYVIHVPWIIATRILMNKLNINLTLGVEFALSLTLLIPISIIINRYFDKPSYKLLNNIFKTSQLKPNAVSKQ